MSKNEFVAWWNSLSPAERRARRNAGRACHALWRTMRARTLFGLLPGRMQMDTLELAFSRGTNANTFATHDELRTPGYDDAYKLGAEYRDGRVVEPHVWLGCGCPACRLERIRREHKR